MSFFKKFMNLEMKKKGNKFFYFGRMIDYKGVDLIIEAVLKLKENRKLNFI